MPAIAKLLLQPKELASFIAAAIYRDTRAAELDDVQRMNFFPANPLMTVTLVLQGQLHMGHGKCGIGDLKELSPLAHISVACPSDEPTVSWSPGELVAITLAIYPDAWARVTGQPNSRAIPSAFLDALSQVVLDADVEVVFELFCEKLIPFWDRNRRKGPFPDWAGSDRIADWTRHIVAARTSTHSGHSTRSIQRMLRRWTGRSQQSLEFYAKLEKLHQARVRAPNAELAHTALDADFADQSHMGRSLKRTTGFSPATLNDKIATEEAFWCYRLLGERF